MKKAYIYLMFLLAGGLSGCTGFLDETPNKAGSAYIYHMDQLHGLTGNYALYLHFLTGNCWAESIFRGDGVEYSPYWCLNGNRLNSYDGAYGEYVWDNSDTAYSKSAETATVAWTPSWNAIFTFNTVLENMDNVIQTTPETRKQVEGEALFGRAYYHFILLVQYALWDVNAPGIGYRTNTLPNAVHKRETVKYTLDRIYEDLDNAEKALTAAGRVHFEPERNFRPTLPTLNALRARVDLYRGDYSSALERANAALAGHNVLLDFKNDPRYRKLEYDVNVLDETDSRIVEVLKYHTLPDLSASMGMEAFAKHPEFYLPHNGAVFYTNDQIPVSEFYFNLFDRENDERWKMFYANNNNLYNGLIPKTVLLDGNTTPTARCFTWADQQGMKEAHRHTYRRFMINSIPAKWYILGPTTAEMYLIKAECLARAGQTGDAAEVLKTLRRTRFTTLAAADNIGGSVQEVLDERAREMTEIWRFFDIKRLNGAENAGITIRRTILTDFTDVNKTRQIEIAPDDPCWALPIYYQQIKLSGWEQNGSSDHTH